MLGRDIDASLLLQAVDYANKTGLPTIDKVRSYLAWHNAATEARIDDTVVVNRQGLLQYDTLLNGEVKQDE